MYPSRWNARLLFLVLVCFCLGTSELRSQPPAGHKVYSIIRQTLSQLEVLGVRAANAHSMDLQRRFGSRAVSFDSRGRLGLILDVSDVTPALAARIGALGGSVLHSIPEARLLSVYLPIDQVDAVASLPEVRIVRPMTGGVANTGSQTSEGDTIHHAAAVRSDLNITGDSIDVGVISDGCVTWAVSLASGDLPAFFGPPSYTYSNGNKIGAGDEGTAMMEIVHDLAPASALHYYGALGMGGGSATMIDAIYKLGREKGCCIIVDDLTYFDQPMFEDGTPATAGTIAAAAQWAVDTGIVYISSAGNYARGGVTDRSHYQATYTDGNPPSNIAGPKPLPSPVAPGVIQAFGPSFEDLHDFDSTPGTDAALTLIRPPNTWLYVILEWNDPWGASADDYDLYLYNATLTVQKGASTTNQAGAQNPYEIIQVADYPWADTLNVLIDHVTAAGAPKLLGLYISGCSWVEYSTPENSIWGQPGVADVISVGAVPYNNSSAIENFSSRGTYDVYVPLFESREKPDLAAIDGGVITGAGGFGTWDGANWRFYGTSASAPHVAGVAALVRDAWPALPPQQVHGKLERTAVDKGAAGFDPAFGNGLADAERAMLEVDTATGTSGPSAMTVTGSLPLFFVAAGGYAIATVSVTGGVSPPTQISAWATMAGGNPYEDAGEADAECPTLRRWFGLTQTGGTNGQFDAQIVTYVAESERVAAGVASGDLAILHLDGEYYREIPASGDPERVGDTWKVEGTYSGASFSSFFVGHLTRGIGVETLLSAAGPADSVVTVRFQVSNTGTTFDTAKAAMRETRGWSVAPADTGAWVSSAGPPLEIDIRVTIPAGAAVGTIDTVWLVARSDADSSYADSSFATVSVRAKEVTMTTSLTPGWNMVSVPLDVPDWRKSVLFPAAISPAYTYVGLYVSKDTLLHCAGYWVKSDSAREVEMTGAPCSHDSLDVSAGWNMLGSISSPVPAAGVASAPPGIIASNLYTYDGTTYVIADTIRPGRAHWIKVSQAGRLALSIAGPATAGTPRLFAEGELPPEPPGDAPPDAGNGPVEFALHQNYPNPFNPVTRITFALSLEASVRITVCNVLGQEVARLIDRRTVQAGTHAIEFDASGLPAGVYYCTMEAGPYLGTRKLVIVR